MHERKRTTDPATIYALADPRDKSVRYVGKTIVPESRLSVHLSNAKVKYHTAPVCVWIKSLVAEGVRPVMVILETVPHYEGKDAEIRWIQTYLNQGANLTNVKLMNKPIQLCEFA